MTILELLWQVFMALPVAKKEYKPQYEKEAKLNEGLQILQGNLVTSTHAFPILVNFVKSNSLNGI